MENQFDGNGSNVSLQDSGFGNSSNFTNGSNIGTEDPIMSGEPNGQKKQGKGVVLFILLLVMLAVVLGIFFSFAKPNGAGTFLGRLDGYHFNLFSEMENFTKENETNKTSVTVDLKDILEEAGEKDTDLEAVKVEVTQSNSDERTVGELKLLYGDKSILNMQYVAEESKAGLKVEDITDSFIALDLEKIDKLLENLEISKEDLNAAFEQNMNMTLDEFIEALKEQQNAYEISVEELDEYKDVLMPYLKMITSALDKNEKIENDVEIEVAGQVRKTTRYYVEIDEEMLNSVMLEILLKAQKDTKLYAMFEDILVTYAQKEGSIELDEIEELKTEFSKAYQEGITEAIDSLTKTEENEEEETTVKPTVVLSIYNEQGHTVAVTFDLVVDTEYGKLLGYRVAATALREENKGHMEFALEQNTPQLDEDGKPVQLENSEIAIDRENSSRWALAFDVLPIENGYQGEVKVDMHFIQSGIDFDENYNIINTNKTTDFDATLLTVQVEKADVDTEIFEDFDSKKTVWLHEKTKEELETMYQKIIENATKYIEDMAPMFGGTQKPQGSIGTSSGNETVNMATVALFDMELGDFSSSVALDAADMQVYVYRKRNAFVNDANILYSLAKGLSVEEMDVTLQDPDGYKIPEKIREKMNLGETEKAYLVENMSNISGYDEDTNFTKNPEEKVFLTTSGKVFVIPGLPLKNGNVTDYYIAPNIYYEVNEGESIITMNDFTMATSSETTEDSPVTIRPIG